MGSSAGVQHAVINESAKWRERRQGSCGQGVQEVLDRGRKVRSRVLEEGVCAGPKGVRRRARCPQGIHGFDLSLRPELSLHSISEPWSPASILPPTLNKLDNIAFVIVGQCLPESVAANALC